VSTAADATFTPIMSCSSSGNYRVAMNLSYRNDRIRIVGIVCNLVFRTIDGEDNAKDLDLVGAIGLRVPLHHFVA
jgi:hypothetical protein